MMQRKDDNDRKDRGRLTTCLAAGLALALSVTGPAYALSLNGLKEKVSQAGEAVKDAGSAIGDAAKGAGSAIGDAAKGAGSAIGDAAKGAGEAISGAAQDAGEAIGSAAQSAGDAIGSKVGEAKDWIDSKKQQAAETESDDEMLRSGASNATEAEQGAEQEAEETADTVTVPMDELKDVEKYYLGSVVNTGTDNGYSGSKSIGKSDPHFGWTLGKFFVSGYTRVTADEADPDAADIPVFLKTVGDTVTMWFSLEQDIDALNGNADLVIADDKDGYDVYFGINKTDFGRGTLIIRHTNYQNLAGDATIYTNYLPAKLSDNAATEVELFEEGDYEVALNYKVQDNPRKVLGKSILPTYNDYRIFFRFSVRNGNCMVYPFDVVTGEELTNSAVTENGFRLDLARSRYLDINIRKETMKEGADGLIEDVRFNRPARDGDEYTDEGIYTITVENRYTDQKTEKKIYVGTNDVLKAYAETGLSISEIKKQIAAGATIAEDGTIVPAEDDD